MTAAIKADLPRYTLEGALLGYLLVSAPVQEILFRTFLIPRLERLTKNRLFLIAFTTAIFGTIHLPLHNPYLTISSYVLGAFWAATFLSIAIFTQSGSLIF